MTMTTSTRTDSISESQSRFIRLLGEAARRRKARGRTGSLGFLPATAPKDAVRSLALIAGLAKPSAAAASALVEAGAVALFGPLSAAASLVALAETLSVPLGIELDAAEAGDWDAVPAEGMEWVGLSLAASPRALVHKKPARLLSIPLDISIETLRAVAAAPIEAILITPPLDGVPALTLETALRLRFLSETLRQPTLLDASLIDDPADVEVLLECGVVGVVVPQATPAVVAALAAALDALPAA